jgi:hypothetical protein
VKAIWRNRVDVQAIGGPVADALDDIVGAINTQPLELSLPNGPTTRIHSGIGSPEGVVVGSPGDLFLRSDGTTSTTVCYMKTSGKNTKTGWVFTGQIAFPAVQNPSTDANTLDDYEEGLWTPTDVSGAGLTFTVIQQGQYVKVGQLVTATVGLLYPATASGAGNAISGLPFTNQPSQYGATVYYTDFGAALTGVVLASSTTVSFFTMAGAQITNVALSGKNLRFTATYRASA